MAENEAAKSEQAGAPGPPRTTNEVALELMKFITVTTGYGKVAGSGTGFSSKPASRTAEEHAESLLELFERCRTVVKKED